MTSATQIVAPGYGTAPGYGASAIFGRAIGGRPNGGVDVSDDRRDSTALPGRDRDGEAEALPGRQPPPAPGTAPSSSDVVRLPGQEGVPEGGPRRPLISGGAFTLAVAIGLSLDQRTEPEALEPATPSTTGGAAAGEGGDPEDEQGIDGLTEGERETVKELQKSDAEVRRHEAAHAAAGGEFAGAPTFTFQTGPDGKRYAVGGEVSIDTAPVKGDPEATIRKAQRIQAAANAPADPSAQDRRVAAQANALRQQAQAELAAERRDEQQAGEAGAEPGDAGTPPAEGAAADAGAPPADAGAPPADASGSAATVAPPDGTAQGIAPADAERPVQPGPTAADETATGRREEAGDRSFALAAGTDEDAGTTESPGGPDADRGPFAPGAFSAAAASYRGPAVRQNLVSIAV